MPDSGTLVIPSGVSAPSFSFTEIKTGLRWIDGKPIFQRTIQTPRLPNNGGAPGFPHGITNIDRIVNIRSIADNGVTWAVSPGLIGGGVEGLEITANRTNIGITVWNMNANDYTRVYVTLQYTKTP